MPASYCLTALFDDCVAQRQLVSCSMTRPFLSLLSVWLARLVCVLDVLTSLVPRPPLQLFWLAERRTTKQVDVWEQGGIVRIGCIHFLMLCMYMVNLFVRISPSLSQTQSDIYLFMIISFCATFLGTLNGKLLLHTHHLHYGVQHS